MRLRARQAGYRDPVANAEKRGLGNAKQKAQSQRQKLALCNKEQEILNIHMIPLKYLGQVCLWVYTKQVDYFNNTFPLNAFETILKSLFKRRRGEKLIDIHNTH